MRIRVRGDHLEQIDGWRRYLERRLRFALGRFQERIRRVTVRVVADDGPGGDATHRGRVVVDLIPSGSIVVEDAGSELFTVIDWVAERTGQAVGRELARRRDQDGRGCA